MPPDMTIAIRLDTCAVFTESRSLKNRVSVSIICARKIIYAAIPLSFPNIATTSSGRSCSLSTSFAI